MRVICICSYRNEADIIEAFVRHTATFCDELVLLDHGSTDESPEIVHYLQRDGFRLHLLADATLGNIETDQSNRLLQFAADELSADWILALDADEFISGAADNSFLPRAIENETTCLKLRSLSYYVHGNDRADLLNPVERITHRPTTEEESDLKVFVPGWLVRRGGGFLTQGKHQYLLHTHEAPAPITDQAVLAHFSLRSPSQYAIKLISKQLQKSRLISKQGDELVYYNQPYALLKGCYSEFEETFPAQRLAYKTRAENEELISDPIAYRGGPLSYTPEKSAGADRFVREALELAEELARFAKSPATEASPNGVEATQKLTLELTSGPSPGHTEVLNSTIDRARFHSAILALDCPPDANELRLSLRADPGLLEISEIVLHYPKSGCGKTYGVDELQKMIRVLEGGAVIAPTDVFRILISKEPVRLSVKGWLKPNDEMPNELLLRVRLEHHLVPATLLSPSVLNAIAQEQRELALCRINLEEARRETSIYKGYLSKSAYSVGSIINFTSNGNSSFYTGHGWSHAEEWGTWTDGERAELNIRFEDAPKRPLRLNARLGSFVHEQHRETHVRVLVAGDEVARWTLSSAEAAAVQAEIPAEKLRRHNCNIVFEILNPISPVDLGFANDSRRLGVGFHTVDLQWADASAGNGGNVS